MLRMMERLAAACEKEEKQGRKETRRKAMQVVTSVSGFARAAKNCQPLVDFYNKWNLELVNSEYAHLYWKLFREKSPNTQNAAFCWAVLLRRVFDEQKLPRDTSSALSLHRSIYLCVKTTFHNTAVFQAFALELMNIIFPRYAITNTEVRRSDKVWFTYSGGRTFGVFNYLPYDALWIGTRADHAGEGRTVEALAAFCSRRNLGVDMDHLGREYRDIFEEELPAAPFPADAWAAFLKRVLDENKLEYRRYDSVFERAVWLCLLPTFPANRQDFVAELADLLFPNDAPCEVFEDDDVYDDDDGGEVVLLENVVKVAFRQRSGGPLFSFRFDARDGSIEFGLNL